MFANLSIPCSEFNVVVQNNLRSPDYMRIYYEIFQHINRFAEVDQPSEWLVSGGLLTKIENGEPTEHQYVITDDLPGYQGPGAHTPISLFTVWRNDLDGTLHCIILPPDGVVYLMSHMTMGLVLELRKIE